MQVLNKGRKEVQDHHSMLNRKLDLKLPEINNDHTLIHSILS
jgi:hypothetical protein